MTPLSVLARLPSTQLRRVIVSARSPVDSRLRYKPACIWHKGFCLHSIDARCALRAWARTQDSEKGQERVQVAQLLEFSVH